MLRPCALLVHLATALQPLKACRVEVLVTCNDFMDPDFKQNLCATVEDLLQHGTVPIFNENDSISKGAKQSKARALVC